MLTENALVHFDQLWNMFDKTFSDMKGSLFLIDPFKEFFPKSFVDNLTAKSAQTRLHEGLKKWGEVEQSKHSVTVVAEHTLEDGGKLNLTDFKSAEVRSARRFILSSFYNLCCLAAHKKTIEELIFVSMSGPYSIPMSKNSIKAFARLIAFSNSFLLAEWAQDIIHKAVANSDDDFFKALSKSIKKNTAVDKFPVARTWLGTILLWYLGGKDLKRREFLALLSEKSLVSPSLDLPSFNAMLSRLHLIKQNYITKTPPKVVNDSIGHKNQISCVVELSDISNTPSEKLIQLTLETFQPFYDQELTKRDALEIIESLASASEILLEIAEETETSSSEKLEK